MEAMVRYANDLGASAGRGAYREAIDTAHLMAECRQRLNTLFNGENPNHFVFTLNCSDSLNLAIKGLIDPSRSNHAICTYIDHNSILRPLNAMQDLGWLSQTRVPVDSVSGVVDPEAIRKAIRPDTRLIAITQASNVSGTIQPIAAIGRIAREAGIPLVVDAAQSAGHIPIDVQKDYIDLLAAPGHKALFGPLGTGFLYVRPGIEKILRPLKEGGTGSISEIDRQPDFMPDKYEPGSQNAIGIAGLSAGVKWVLDYGIEKIAEHDLALVRMFLDGISDVEGLTLIGPPTVRNRLGVFSVRVDGFDPHELAAVLESEFGILTRPGIHCAPLAHETFGTTQFGGTTRFSFSPMLSVQDVKFATDALAQIASQAVRS